MVEYAEPNLVLVNGSEQIVVCYSRRKNPLVHAPHVHPVPCSLFQVQRVELSLQMETQQTVERRENLDESDPDLGLKGHLYCREAHLEVHSLVSVLCLVGKKAFGLEN